MSDPAHPLAGKVALVTGSSRGIGRAIALELACQGADVVVNYRRNADAAQAVAAGIEGMGRRAIALPANVAEQAEVEAMFAAVAARLGGVDLLVCNAASGKAGKLTDLGPRALNLAFSVNALGTLLCAQAAAPGMKARGGGRIVVISSPGATRVFPDYAVVGASKAAVDILVQYLAVELASHHIVVNAVAPGICDTEALHNYLSQAQIDDYVARTPMKRNVTPEEIATLVAFLCRDDVSMICGQTIAIDGGFFLPF